MEQPLNPEKTDRLSSEMIVNAISDNSLKQEEIWSDGHVLGDGKYTLQRKLGKGGFGVTYLAKTAKDEFVVIKTLNEEEIKPEYLKKCREDFYEEALSLARCDHHPNIVSIKTVIPDPRFPCLVMEYIPGLTLEEMVNTHGVLSEEVALKYIRQIGNALISIHQRKYLHRDIKPQNIIIHEKTGSAILIDFGIARNFDPDQTQQHTAFLSKGYTPIEQIYAGDKHSSPGFYTDVYGLAATLYYSLTQTIPTDSQTRLYHLSQGDPDPLLPAISLNSAISEEVNLALLKGLKVQHQYRSPTVESWLKLLPDSNAIPITKEQTIPSENTATLPLLSPPLTIQRQPQLSQPIVLGLLGVLGLGIIGIIGLILPRINSQPPTNSLTHNCIDNLCLSYPNNWQLNLQKPNAFDPRLAELISPTQPNSLISTPKIIVEQYPLNSTANISQLLEESEKNINQNLKEGKILKSEQIKLDNYPAYRLVYTSQENQSDVKRMQLGILGRDILYLVTYEAILDEDNNLEPVAENIMNSITLSK